jgi:hypothetical protein
MLEDIEIDEEDRKSIVGRESCQQEK